MKKQIGLYAGWAVFLLVILLFSLQLVSAVCPVCTVAVAGCVGLSRWLGVDDVITGLWVGGLVISSALWFASWWRKKRPNAKYTKILSIVLFYLIVFVPLYFTGLVGHPLNKIFGFDRLMFGTAVGSILFLIAVSIDHAIRKKNNGKVLFFYQKVVIPVVLLVIASGAFYYLNKLGYCG